MTLPVTYSADEVATALGRDRAWLIERAAERPDLWPSLKVGKQVRFTAEQVDQIVTRCTRSADTAGIAKVNSFGRPVRPARRRAPRRTA